MKTKLIIYSTLGACALVSIPIGLIFIGKNQEPPKKTNLKSHDPCGFQVRNITSGDQVSTLEAGRARNSVVNGNNNCGKSN